MSEGSLGKPAQLGHLLQNLVRRKGIAEESARNELDNIWKTAAGDRIASRSHVRKLRGGILEIGVTNGAILEELTCYLQHELLRSVQELHSEPAVNSLKFVKVN